MHGGRWLTRGETGGGKVQKGGEDRDKEGEEQGKGRKGSEGIRGNCVSDNGQ